MLRIKLIINAMNVKTKVVFKQGIASLAPHPREELKGQQTLSTETVPFIQ